jgi:sodium transport system permease protein
LSPVGSGAGRSPRAFRLLLRRELTEALRDRRTLVFTFALPLLLYPVLLAAMGMAIEFGRDRLRQEQLTVAFTSPLAEALLGPVLPVRTTGTRLERPAAERALAEQRIAAAVEVTEASGAALDRGGSATVTLLYTRRFDASKEALERLRPVVEAQSAQRLEARLRAQVLEPGFGTPLRLEAVDVILDRRLGPLVADLLPMIFLLWLFGGTLTSAVDVMAGEKERGTLETLLVSAVDPLDILRAKFVLVFGLAVSSTLVNVAAMALTLGAGFIRAEGVALTYAFSSGQVAMLLLCLVPTALLVTGLALSVASVARTSREGQTLMSPLLIAGLMPGFIVQLPGIELGPATAAVPLLNVALLVKGVVLQTATWPLVLETVVVVLGCSALALRLAAVLFVGERSRLGGAPSPGGRSKGSTRR